MKATPWAASATSLALLLAGFCAFSSAPASAQAAGADIFAVNGVQVDVTAANGATAQSQAFAAASQAGFERLTRRITPAADQARLGTPQLDPGTLENLARSRDIANERRSGTRYLATFNVQFDPVAVRAALRGAGYANLIETRGPRVVVVAASDSSVTPDVAIAWRDAWTQGGFEHELAPIALAPANVSAGDWAALSGFAQSEGVASVTVATLHVDGLAARVSLRDVSAAGPRDRAPMSLTATDSNNMRSTLLTLAIQAASALEDDWKARAGAGATVQRGRVSASAIYSDEAQWERIKAALGASATVISGIRIEAVARDGALVSFSFAGDRAQVAAELARRGVTLEDSASGPVLRVAR